MTLLRLDRRTLLKGAGSIVIALPALPQLVRAQPATTKRLVTYFFGNGMPPDYTATGFQSSVLAPLAPHAPHITLVRGIHNQSAEGGSGHPHARGGGSFAVGHSNPEVGTAGGKSLDVVAYEHFKPQTPISNLAASLWWWSEDPVRSIHSWQGPNKPNPGVRKPLDLFTRLFGGGELMPGAETPAEQALAMKQRRYQRSVLDSVLEGYRHVQSEASGYGADVRATLADHFETVRSLERRAIALEQVQDSGGFKCAVPSTPPDITPQQTCYSGCATKGSTGDHDAGGGMSNQSNWDQVWPLTLELFVAGLRCNVSQFGNLTCSSAGDRYTYKNQDKNVHDLAHGWRPGAENGFIENATWLMQGFARFLELLADPAYPTPSGATLLQETTVLAGTEVGDPAPTVSPI